MGTDGGGGDCGGGGRGKGGGEAYRVSLYIIKRRYAWCNMSLSSLSELGVIECCVNCVQSSRSRLL